MVRRLVVFPLVALVVSLGCVHSNARGTSAQSNRGATNASARPASAQANGPVGVSIQPATASVAPGQTTTLTLQLNAPDAGAGAWTADIQYDPSVIQVTDCTASGASLCNAGFAPNGLRVTGASVGGVTGTQTLATITVQAVGDAGSSTPLTVNLSTFTDPQGNSIAGAAGNGEIDVAGS